MTETYGRSIEPKKPYVIELMNGRSLLFMRTQWWRIVSPVNGQVIATSETYSTREKRNQTATRVSEASGFQILNPGDC